MRKREWWEDDPFGMGLWMLVIFLVGAAAFFSLCGR